MYLCSWWRWHIERRRWWLCTIDCFDA